MTRALICLGANQADAAEKIAAGWGMLAAAGCRAAACSPVYSSSSGYENQVVDIETGLPCADLVRLAKRVERELGRVPEMKARGIVPIDIDIVVYDGQVMRQADFDSAYFRDGLRLMAASNDAVAL